ncbi:MAG: hypothetical protein RIF41_02495 [Polyangiaceae bacterium]
MVESQSVTLEEFARLTARIDAGESVEKVLAGSDLDADRWADVQRTWLTRMAERAARGKPSLHQRFVGLLDEHRREVEAARRAEKQLDGPLPEPPAERKAPVLVRRRPEAKAPASPPRAQPPRRPSPAAVPATPPAEVHVPPNPRRPPTAAMPAGPAGGPSLPFGDQRSVLPFAGSPSAGSPTAGSGSAPSRGSKPTVDEPHVLPFRSTAPAPPNVPAQPTATAPPNVPAQPTAPAPHKAPAGPEPSALPFRERAEAKPPPPADLGAEPRNLGATMAMSSEDFAAARAALLPFLEKKEPTAETPAPQELDFGSTSYISPEDMAKARAALPFGAPPASADATGDDTAEIPPDRNDAVPTETAEVPPDRAPAALPFEPSRGSSSAASPPREPTPAAQPSLSLEQYAWLCATLERSSAKLDETLAWLRMSREQKAELDASWRAAMARDGALAARFESLRQSYLSQR